LFIAQTLVHSPDILILDEPTAGLDPIARVELRELVRDHASNRIVVMATHLMEDVAHLGGEVLVLDAGRVIFEGTSAQLARRADDAQAGSSRLGSAAEIGFIELFSEPRGGGK
jgi:ABC-2 type transport system ATP-binding protein